MLYKHCCVETAQHFVLRSIASSVRSELRPLRRTPARDHRHCWAHQTTAHFAATCRRGDLIDIQISIDVHTHTLSLSVVSRGQRGTTLRAWSPLSTGWPGRCPATGAATSACSAASCSPSPSPWTTATPTSTPTSSHTSDRTGTNRLL